MPRTTRPTKRLTATERSGAALVRISTAMRRDGTGRVPGLFILQVVLHSYSDGAPQRRSILKTFVRTRREVFAQASHALSVARVDEASRLFVLDAARCCWQRITTASETR